MTPEQKKRFKYWQTRTIIATMVGYALFYFVRKNFSLAMPGLEADLGISKTSLGIFLTLNGVVYGLSRFVNGVLADRRTPAGTCPSVWRSAPSRTSPSDSAKMSPTGLRANTTARSSPTR